jgi:membrane fusion protein, copper/silver efflux system
MKKMNKATRAILLLFVVAGMFLAGAWYRQEGAVKAAVPGARKVLYYVDPMHPAYKSDKPGVAPDCGMELVPVYEDAIMGGARSGASGPPGTVNISPEKQQLLGVQLRPVERAAGTHMLRLLGRVAADETRVYKLIAGLDGAMREVAPVTTGSRVEKDQWLATYFSLETRIPIQAYLSALDVLDRAARVGETAGQVKAADTGSQLSIERLKNLGMSVTQIEEIRRTRDVPLTVRIHAPANGFVLARNVSPGQNFEKGAEWYRIADLSRVWILADVYVNEAHYLRAGVQAQVTLPEQRTSFPAKISEVLPQFDANSRTLKVRLEADNPGFVLRPDMFVDVQLPIALPPAITVSTDALLDSGVKKTVFVDRGEGIFEPRAVETGWRLGDRIEIVHGLEPGERVVVSGAFLLDSESRMSLAASGINGERHGGQELPGHEHGSHDHGGHQP